MLRKLQWVNVITWQPIGWQLEGIHCTSRTKFYKCTRMMTTGKKMLATYIFRALFFGKILMAHSNTATTSCSAHDSSIGSSLIQGDFPFRPEFTSKSCWPSVLLKAVAKSGSQSMKSFKKSHVSTGPVSGLQVLQWCARLGLKVSHWTHLAIGDHGRQGGWLTALNSHINNPSWYIIDVNWTVIDDFWYIIDVTVYNC